MAYFSEISGVSDAEGSSAVLAGPGFIPEMKFLASQEFCTASL